MKNNGNAAQKFLSSVSMPLEVAMSNYDEVAHFLIALGAEVNLPTKNSLQCAGENRDEHYTALDYARVIVSRIEEAQNPVAQTTVTQHAAMNTGTTRRIRLGHLGRGGIFGGAHHTLGSTDTDTPVWKTELRKIVADYEKAQKERNPEPTYAVHHQTEYLDELKEYFDEVATTLQAHQGKPGGDVFRGKMSDNGDARLRPLENRLPRYYKSNYTYISTLSSPGFHRHGMNEGSGMIAELAARYEELFVACWSGNNTKIQKLCLPQQTGKNQETPLQISCHWGDNFRGQHSETCPIRHGP